MSAYSGTYRVEGAKLIITIEDSSIQSWNGTKRVINFETDGKRLTGTSEPFKGPDNRSGCRRGDNVGASRIDLHGACSKDDGLISPGKGAQSC